MMKITVSKSILLKDCNLRLDAGYHLSDGQLTLSAFKQHNMPTSTLKNVTERIFYGGRARRVYVKNADLGLSFIKGADIDKADFSSLNYISRKRTDNLDEYFLEEGWTVLTRSGTIGNTAFVNKDFLGKAASDDLIRVIPKTILPGFLYAFLSSKFGKSLLTHGTYGAVIQHIEPEHIENIPIPIFPTEKQIKIHELITQSAELRVEANKLLDRVINQIESQYFISPKYSSYPVNINSIKQGDKFTKEFRLEADFYQPHIVNLINDLKKQKWAYLGDISTKIQRSGLRERRFVKTGIPLITGQNLNVNRLDGLKMLSSKLTKNIDKNITRECDILISVQGTIGKIEYSFNNIFQGVFASEQLTKVSVNQSIIHPGYIYAFLKSKLGQLQLQKFKTGSVIEWIIENNIASIIIPIPIDIGMEVGKIVNRLTLMRQEAFELESTAIKFIETEINQWQQ